MCARRTLFDFLAPYRQKTESFLEKAIDDLGGPSRLREACAYSLSTSGKRVRPALALMVGGDAAAPGALAVEFLHTASLIADDLPCMDNDETRRGRPSLHVAFDEQTALLASYSLIASAYEQLSLLPAARCQIALRDVSRATGLHGITGGQYRDMHHGQLGPDELLEIIDQKTGTLFEVSLLVGWLSGNGSLDKLDQLKACARHFGRAFQLVDDLADQADEREGAPNAALVLGPEWTKAKAREELSHFGNLAQALDLTSLQELQRLFSDLITHS